jgi:predicted metal-binding membrane protein
MPASTTVIERVLRHERAALAVVLIAVPIAAWWWVVALARDMYGPMTGASAWMMTTVWDGPHLLLLWAMWTVMMAGMMVPSAAPMLLLYGRAVRSREGEGRAAATRVYALASGYLVVWALFSVAATVLQRALAGLLLLTPMMEPATPFAGGVILVAAGAYQFLPIKRRCLQGCRSPLGLLMRHWAPGGSGAFRIGITHGMYCVGCCWALMLLLFAGGVMNLAVILALTVWVVAEKLMPFGEQGALAAGALLVALGGWMMLG